MFPWARICLPCQPEAREQHQFVVWAVKDPTSGNLDRIQIIKGWTKNGQSFEKIFDVAWAGDRKPDKWSGRVPAIQSTVNIEKAIYENSVGATELKTVWSDPEFDARLHAFYYARVWRFPRNADSHSGRQSRDSPAGCGPAHGAGTRLEFADLVSAVRRGTEERSRRNDGRRPQGERRHSLDNTQLKDLIVGKAFWMRNNVTGEQFSENFTEEGQMIVFRVGESADMPSGFGNVMRDGYRGQPAPTRVRTTSSSPSSRRTPTPGRSTNLGTRITPRGAASSAMPTTRSFRRRKSR